MNGIAESTPPRPPLSPAWQPPPSPPPSPAWQPPPSPPPSATPPSATPLSPPSSATPPSPALPDRRRDGGPPRSPRVARPGSTTRRSPRSSASIRSSPAPPWPRGRGALLEIAGTAVEWQGCALIDLASGHSVDDVAAHLGIGPDAVDPTAPVTEDEQLLRGLSHPAARMSFTYVEDDAELRRVIDGGDFDAWRVFLHPEQASSPSAPSRAVPVVRRRGHRQDGRRPAPRSPPGPAFPRGPVVLTTFTTNLADALRADLHRLDPDLPLASGWASPGCTSPDRRHRQRRPAHRHRRRRRRRHRRTDRARHRQRPPRRTHPGTPGGTPWTPPAPPCPTVSAARPSRRPSTPRSPAPGDHDPGAVLPGAPARTGDRPRPRQTQRRLGRRRGLPGPGQDRRHHRLRRAATIAAGPPGPDRRERQEFVADHVLVDEGQDLSPAHWQLLRALAAEHPDDLFLAEDSHQRIYGQRVTLSRFGIRWSAAPNACG